MQNQMASPAATGKHGIPLSQELFRRAIDKALALKPRVLPGGAHYGVMMSDQRSWAHVIFCAWDGRIYASYNCRAHTIGHHGVPMPCYHIAAAALSKGATALLAADRAVAPAPMVRPSGHTHAFPSSATICTPATATIQNIDVVCEVCGARPLDWAASFGQEKNYWQ